MTGDVVSFTGLLIHEGVHRAANVILGRRIWRRGSPHASAWIPRHRLTKYLFARVPASLVRPRPVGSALELSISPLVRDSHVWRMYLSWPIPKAMAASEGKRFPWSGPPPESTWGLKRGGELVVFNAGYCASDPSGPPVANGVSGWGRVAGGQKHGSAVMTGLRM
jgi:hypothetical protein